jgi:hypothetical protein
MMQPVKAPLLLVIASLAALHAAQAAEAVPKPKLRPAAPASVTAAAVPVPRLRPSAAAPVTPAAAIPVPQLRPLPETGEPPPRAEKPSEPPAKGEGGWPADAVAEGRAACKSLLSGLDVTYRIIDPIGGPGGCGAPAPIEVSAVAGVKLSPAATQTCAMAAALAAWVTQDVQPAARKRLDTEVTEIRTATSYSCRRRNNGASGKMSEHSKANALDMAGFTFAKRADVTVGGKANWGDGLLAAAGLSKGGSFLEDIRKAACRHFTTVLGPGSDPYHGDHFHVDVLQRKGNYRICQ